VFNGLFIGTVVVFSSVDFKQLSQQKLASYLQLYLVYVHVGKILKSLVTSVCVYHILSSQSYFSS